MVEEVTLLSENLFSDSLVLWDEIYIHLAQLAALILPHCTAPRPTYQFMATQFLLTLPLGAVMFLQ